MHSDVGGGAVQAVVLGDGDLKRRSFREPQGAAEAEHHPRIDTTASDDPGGNTRAPREAGRP